MTYNVLFLCTGNSARSIMAEAILNRAAPDRFKAWSAGSQPKGSVHPQALALLERTGHDTSALRSKSWDEFGAGPDFDFIFTVCDNAAEEVCPVWPGHPMTAHWGIPDPAAATGSDHHIELAFRAAYLSLDRRIALFTALPLKSLDRLALKSHLETIGRHDG